MDITGAVSDETTGFLTISNAQYANLNSLYFNIGGVCTNLFYFVYLALLTIVILGVV